MSLTICTCTLDVKDILGNSYSTCELVCEPRKSQVNSGDGIYLSKAERTQAVNGVCTLALAETTTNNVYVVFSLKWNDGNNFNDLIFSPVLIPNQASVDLSTILTVSRG